MLKQLFLIKPVNGDKNKKTFFLPIVSHIELNYAFLLFWNIFREIQRELLFLVKKWLSQKRAMKNSEICFFNMFEKGKSWLKLGFVKTTLFDQTSKWGQKKKKKIRIISHIQLNYPFQLFEEFSGKFKENFSF